MRTALQIKSASPHQKLPAMPTLKSERHHWWPRCVSEHWKDDRGEVSCLLPSGEVRRGPPKKIARIGNGHHIKMNPGAPTGTVWDESFESEFNAADNAFPKVITWLEGLDRRAVNSSSLRARFRPQKVSDEELTALVEAIVSLVVRSPRFREACVSVAEHFRGPLPEPERNKIIGLSMRRAQRMFANAFGVRGKFAAIFSPRREFIFGDGFFQNLSSPSGPPISARILVPITPRIAVLYVKPTQCVVDPRFVTLVIDEAEADQLNHAVRVYARREIYYRAEKPAVGDEFTCGVHARYSRPDNPIDCLIHELPGLPPRDLDIEMMLHGLCVE